MLDECAERKFQTDRRIIVTQVMIKHLRFKGNGANFIEGVLNDKLNKLQSDRKELDDATTAAKGVYDMLKDYEATDRPASMSTNEEESHRIRAISGMLQSAFVGRANKAGKRRGGMPFGGV